MSQEGWEWFGKHGHLIVGQWCRFHLATWINKKYLVSTVGEYVHPRHSGSSEIEERHWLEKNWPGEDIGYGRKYETMVFDTIGRVCENEGCNCGIPLVADTERDFCGYNNAKDATHGHYELCEKWDKK